MKEKIIVQREVFEKEGKTYFNYFVEGKVKSKTPKVNLVPHDIGGYAVLDIVFEDVKEVYLDIRAIEMKADNGSTQIVNTYVVVSVDESGDIYECPVKPRNKSDKTLLTMIAR